MGLSLREYASHRKGSGLTGGTLRAVQKAIEAGRISRLPDGTIDPADADARWIENSLGPGGGAPTGRRSRAQREAAPPPAVAPVDPFPYEPVHDDGSGNKTLVAAKALKETYLAGQERFNLEERAGELVRKVEVQAEAHALGRLIRDKLLELPDRLAGGLAAVADELEVSRILNAELRQVLTELVGSGD